MDTINQLILDCTAKVLRINQTTSSDVEFQIRKAGIQCYGYKCGYSNTLPKAGEKYPQPDFVPLPTPMEGGISYLGNIYLAKGFANEPEKELHALLDSLNALEKELISSTDTEKMEVNNENHE